MDNLDIVFSTESLYEDISKSAIPIGAGPAKQYVTKLIEDLSKTVKKVELTIGGKKYFIAKLQAKKFIYDKTAYTKDEVKKFDKLDEIGGNGFGDSYVVCYTETPIMVYYFNHEAATKPLKKICMLRSFIYKLQKKEK